MKTKSPIIEFEEEFDKWFNHGTKDKPRFVYASDGYKEIKIYVNELLKRQHEHTLEDLKMRIKSDMEGAGDACMASEGTQGCDEANFLQEVLKYFETLDDLRQRIKEIK